MVQKYVVTDLIVDAVRWTGNNFDEVEKFAGKSVYTLADGITLNIGDYIVKSNYFNLRVIPKKVFEDVYCIVTSSSIVVP